MRLLKYVNYMAVISMLVCLASCSYTVTRAEDGKKKKQKQVEGTPVLWREPANIASLDLYWGPGGEAMKPDTSSVTFLEEKSGGYSKKYRVRDGSGREWVAKLSKEAQPEVAAERLLWAAGYFTETSYLVPSVEIQGKGSFTNVRFEARPDDVKRLDIWSWDRNPFVGTKEFQGLKIMMLLFNNWDIKDDNTQVIAAKNPVTGEAELRYVVSDLGGTFGKTGSFVSRTRNEPQDYVESRFIEERRGSQIDFNYSGKRKDLFTSINAEQARWIGSILSKLTDQQLREAFRAANYNTRELESLATAVRSRIMELAKME